MIKKKGMVLCGTYIKKEAYGRDGFVLKADGDFIHCRDMTPTLKHGVPLQVTGEYKTDAFEVSDIALDTENDAAMVRFLSGRTFRGIGEVKARHIHENLTKEAKTKGEENYSFLNNEEILRALSDLSLDEEVAERITKELSRLRDQTRLYQELKAYGAMYRSAEEAFGLFGASALEVLKENPYAGMRCHMDFFILDRIAKENGHDATKKERIQALCELIADSITENGSSFAKMKTLLNTAKRLQKRSAFEVLPDAFMMLAVLSSDKFMVIESDAYGVIVYPKWLYATESGIAKEIVRLKESAEEMPYQGYRGETALDEDQIQAMGFLRESGVYILTGGPGCGKTTTIREIVKEYMKLRPKDSFFLCAPTGRAAVRISESTGFPATTIHKLLGVLPYGNKELHYRYNRYNRLPKGLYIVDEASMADERIVWDLLEAIPNNSLLIFSGDPRQLPSVSVGKVLRDLCRAQVLKTVELTKIHRQEKDVAIVENYRRIVDRNDKLITDASFHIVRVKTGEEAIAEAYRLYENYASKDPYAFQVLSFMKNSPAGKKAFNEKVLSRRDNARHDRSSKFAAGDKVMMNTNNYAKNYFNGDIGIITKITENGVRIRTYEGEREIDVEDFKDMEHAFATTVHKSQGSEYDVVAILIDDSRDIMLYNAIILTAATRARKEVYVITVNDALEKAVRTYREEDRLTRLDEVLREECAKSEKEAALKKEDKKSYALSTASGM